MDVSAKITNEDGWKRTLEITVPAAEVDTAVEQMTERYRKEAKIPGFRPGKVPASIIRERFEGQIRQDTIEDLVPRAYEVAVNQLKIIPIGSPTLSNVHFAAGKDMQFLVEIEIRPQVEVKDYKGLKLTRQVYEITDHDVSLAIDNLRESQATTTEVQRPAREGDVVICDLQKIHDRLNKVKKSKFDDITFDLREDRTRPEFFKNIQGMGIGEGKEVEVSYSNEESDPDLAGNTVLFRVWLKSVKQKNLPAADDAFAKSLGDFQSLADLQERVKRDLTRRADASANKELARQAREQVVAANAFDVPRGLLDEYLDGVTRRLQKAGPGVTKEAVRNQFEPIATEQFRWDYSVFEIAQKENLTVTEEEIGEVLATWPDDAKDKPSREKIRDSLLENKVYEFLVSAAEVTDTPRVLNPKIIKP
ncbi:MAG: trigger factor [Candidatus Zixiibacteriota bacterium]